MESALDMDTRTLELYLSQDDGRVHCLCGDFPLMKVCEIFLRDLEQMQAQIASSGSAENGRTLKGSELALYAQSLASSRQNVQAAHNITIKFTKSGTSQEIMTHTTMPDGTVSMTFASAEELGRVVSERLRDFLHQVARTHLATINHKTMSQLLSMVLGKGFVSQGAQDILTKGRTYEITLHLGKTRWSPPPSVNDRDDNDKILLYYDRSSGVWEILH